MLDINYLLKKGLKCLKWGAAAIIDILVAIAAATAATLNCTATACPVEARGPLLHHNSALLTEHLNSMSLKRKLYAHVCMNTHIYYNLQVLIAVNVDWLSPEMQTHTWYSKMKRVMLP